MTSDSKQASELHFVKFAACNIGISFCTHKITEIIALLQTQREIRKVHKLYSQSLSTANATSSAFPLFSFATPATFISC